MNPTHNTFTLPTNAQIAEGIARGRLERSRAMTAAVVSLLAAPATLVGWVLGRLHAPAEAEGSADCRRAA